MTINLNELSIRDDSGKIVRYANWQKFFEDAVNYIHGALVVPILLRTLAEEKLLLDTEK